MDVKDWDRRPAPRDRQVDRDLVVEVVVDLFEDRVDVVGEHGPELAALVAQSRVYRVQELSVARQADAHHEALRDGPRGGHELGVAAKRVLDDPDVAACVMGAAVAIAVTTARLATSDGLEAVDDDATVRVRQV